MWRARPLVLAGVVLLATIGLGAAANAVVDPPDPGADPPAPPGATHEPTTTAGTASPAPTDGEGSGDGAENASVECLPNPWRLEDEANYTYDDYGMWMPDRFAADVLETEGVEALYAGMEGQQGQLVHYVETAAGAEPVVYCDATDGEPQIFTDYGSNVTFTPTSARYTADPTDERGMLVSDQSVEWLLSKGRVTAVEATRVETAGGTQTRVTVVVDDGYPAPDWRDDLPEHVDGRAVTFAVAPDG